MVQGVSVYVRKSFSVEAVQVDESNMEEIAAWVKGTIRNSHGANFVKVPVNKPVTDRHTMAFKDDWVVFAGKGFKVYTDKAFQGAFGLREGDAMTQALDSNVFQQSEGQVRDAVLGAISGNSGANPGGTAVR